MTRERTPTPWGIERGRDTLWIGPMRPDGNKVAIIVFYMHYGPDYTDEHNTRQVANAEFIVRAVNSHDDMLATLKAVRKEARKNRPDPDTIFQAADEAISRAESTALSGQT